MTPGVTFDHVSKRFGKGRRADSLRDVVASLTGRLHLARRASNNEAEFWALRDVSFSVEPGEVLGIIGPNGAGKSTILRLLTGLLRPDEGNVNIRGRVGALIELAAGFHPDLTGRENVYLQGAIMGLRKADIARRFDEIVAFADMADFIDTPVKHYSSGMNARLGFSVAAHCEPDVLIIDEVLAVGDRNFQMRAYERLASEVARGVPAVVVSHQLDRIATLCHRAILLDRGRVMFHGQARECVSAYVDGAHLVDGSAQGACPIALDSLELLTVTPVPAEPPGGATVLEPGSRITLRVTGRVTGTIGDLPILGIRIWGLPEETRLGSVHRPAAELALPPAGHFSVDISFAVNLGAGVYRLQGAVWHTPSRTEWGAGKPLLIEVLPRPGSFGGMWLDPHFSSGHE